MSTLQIRNFPDDLKEQLRERSARADLTMSDYVIQLVRADVAEATMAEWLDRLASLPEHPELNLVGAQLVEAARAELGEE